ncbi:aminotransferase class III-fold pyridoxal phosphate-dependent enzyme [Paucibacter sp. DJ1R-11]|uniref:aminotransferase class III-fold pyridoxal phosphate-dependent enzyme n=1 Tax=Paucibacter sp. DJ1R-11 TaxID=2893556 RepID=UPI0021E43E51|nr:aminotransferase class III-fold pyridoxal phosphate-dependent enzyme [Paucibacter sp. DJ1R-11]MCV2366043.1 aminotransferase class III-fold pyridoxal phosphate-dependent enzyme [Paucibacter sp. DJ1R-11]
MAAMVGQAALGKEELLETAGLMVEYSRACGDHLYVLDEAGKEQPVLDLVGGFGSTLLGHNHPELVELLTRCLAQQRPVHAQGSRRQRASELKEALAEYLHQYSGERYKIYLLSTGTEAVEAAIKHARYAYARRMEELGETCAANSRELQIRLERGEIQIDAGLLQQAERFLQHEPLEHVDGLLSALNQRNLQALATPPLMASLPYAFHGKTLGSLALTWNRDARLAFVRNNPDALFVHEPSQFLAQLREHSVSVYQFEFQPLRLVERRLPRLAGLIYEPLRGEGGILELEPEFRDLLLQLHEHHPEVALIADEVQCGLGRTGRPIESAAQGLPADYLTFAKSLGGGLCKISALAVRESLQHREFGMLHSSTFAEDDLSAMVALRGLEILQRDDVAQRCASIGKGFLEGLRALQAAHPDLIRAVRGRGCMLGLELQDLSTHHSPLLASLAQEQLLGMVCAGHLLHAHGLRVLPSLGRRSVLRIQPSAYLQPAEMQQALLAFRALLHTLAAGDLQSLLGHMLSSGFTPPALPKARAPGPAEGIAQLSSNAPVERIGFLAHLIDAQSLREWEPGLAGLSNEQLNELCSRVQCAMEPQLIASRRVRSPLGREVELRLYGIMMDSESIAADMRFNRAQQIRRQVQHAYQRARDEGCGLVGFGGYTSIVTANCIDFEYEHPPVTSGNALTVAASLAATRSSAARMGLDWSNAVVAVVGAAGNIGQVQALLLAGQCRRLLLLGRPGHEARLAQVRRDIASELLRQSAPSAAPASPWAAAFQEWRRAQSGPLDLASLDVWLEQQGWVQLATSLEACRQADIVISASSSPQPVLRAEHFAADRPVLVCDVAVPGDVDASSVSALPQLHLIRGGVVRLPMAPELELPGMQLDPGLIFACAAETLLLGLSGIRADFSKGPVRPEQVREIEGLARLHGFEIDHEKRVGAF